MKTKFDQPHLEPLRYDYQLLSDSYSMKPSRVALISAVLFWVGFVGVVIGFAGLFDQLP